MPRASLTAALLALLAATASSAPFRPDEMGVATIERAPGPHWIWVGDSNFPAMADGRAYLVDAGAGEFLGMLSAGGMFLKVDVPRDRSAIYAAGSFYPRLVRGPRTDVVTIYDPRTLAAAGEVVIPPKRLTSIPSPITSGITDDQRFLVIFNMNPAQSATVVDLAARKVASEVVSAGCALVLPGGERRFHMMCADGSLLTVALDEAGRESSRQASRPFFEPQLDPVTEKPVRLGGRWLFASFDGVLHEVDVGDGTPRFGKPWSLLDEADRAASWRIGGIQHLAVHASRGLLYSLVHQGGVDSHKDPGTEVWVYDVAKRARVKRIALRGIATSILVTQDDAPLLVTAMIGTPGLEVYAAATGEHRHTVPEIGATITLLQNY